MEQLTWGGPTGSLVFPMFTVTSVVMAVIVVLMIVESYTRADELSNDARPGRRAR